MCPQNDSAMKNTEENLSDCSINMDRVILSSADTTCEPFKLFQKKVSVGDVCVGDCDNKARLIDRISGGSFGEVYNAELVNHDNRRAAVKIEPQRGPYVSCLLQEGSVYRNLEGGPGIPNVYWFGYYGSEYYALVMDLLGPTIYHYFRECHGKLSMKTMLMLIDQMIVTLQHIHDQGFIHRDISPSNFVFGVEDNKTKLFLIDFGHAKKFNASPAVFGRRNSVSMPRTVVGTPRFISTHAHLSHQDSPRDDLEALGYMLVYLARGSLPWQGQHANSMQEKLNKIAQLKMNTPIEDVCQGLPNEFAIFLNYTRGLKLYEMADYDGIRQMFKRLAAKLDISYDDAYDWSINEGEHKESSPVPILDDDCDDKNSPNISPVSR